jgi:hypothetical protein
MMTTSYCRMQKGKRERSVEAIAEHQLHSKNMYTIMHSLWCVMHIVTVYDNQIQSIGDVALDTQSKLVVKCFGELLRLSF